MVKRLLKRLRRSPMLAGLAVGAASVTSLQATAAGRQQREKSKKGAEHRLVTTEGRGEVTVRPDSLRAGMAIQVRAETLEQAREEAAKKIQSVIVALKALDIAKLTLRTEGVFVAPIQEESTQEGRLPRIIGYQATSHLSVTIIGVSPDDLGTRGSGILDTALGAGANVVSGLRFFLNDPKEAKQRALVLAVKDACDNVKTLAEASQIKLGSIHSVSGSPESGGGPLEIALDRGLMARPVSLSIETGELRVSAMVTVRVHIAN